VNIYSIDRSTPWQKVFSGRVFQKAVKEIKLPAGGFFHTLLVDRKGKGLKTL
jgi:hypothetical protein